MDDRELQLPIPGAIYQHYKGNLYRVIHIALHSEDPSNRLVNYQRADVGINDDRVWARPLTGEAGWLTPSSPGVDRFRIKVGAPGADVVGVEFSPDAPAHLQPDPSKIMAIVKELESAKIALEKINAIRNSIVGGACFNWSEHMYPLVAALNEAGVQGQEYEEAQQDFGTMLDRALTAEGIAAALWSMLDDIDTLDDAVKYNDAALRKRVYKVQQKRHALLRSDGHNLFRVDTGQDMDGPERAAAVEAMKAKPPHVTPGDAEPVEPERGGN